MFESITGGVDLESLLGSSSNELEKTRLERLEEEVCSMLPSLTFQQRCVGCVVCMVMGYLLSFGSFFRFKDLLLGDPVPFVLTATVGNIIALCGSCFLVGPSSQAKKMLSETRRFATALYLVSLILTIVVAFACKNVHGQGPALVILMICQYGSITWYCLSYVPFARDMMKSAVSRSFSGMWDGDS